MLTLVNDKRLEAGQPTLGFVNPLMYQMAAAKPAAFNDITAGDNKCSVASCLQCMPKHPISRLTVAPQHVVQAPASMQ